MKSIVEVVEKQLCTGCGACSYIQPDLYEMVDDFNLGRRPIKISNNLESFETINVCPGISLTRDRTNIQSLGLNQELYEEWGPVYEVWEGYSTDDEIRYAGSSGGVATALGLFCIEKLKMSGVLHTGASTTAAYLNSSAYSINREQLLDRTGSKYSPASPCDSLSIIESKPSKSVFIGKPCDIAAVQKARKFRSELDAKLGLTIGFFCAGVPSTNGLFELMKSNGIENPILQLRSIRFRGNGWPGLWTANYIDENGVEKVKQMTYSESWGFLQRFRQWRCYICPDHTGEFADISVGDPWYKDVADGEKGRSLIIVRTELGRKILREAVESGYLQLENNGTEILPKSQPNLLNARGILWGRLFALKLLRVARPQYTGFSMFRVWLFNVNIKNKIRSITGTLRRVYSKDLNKTVRVKPNL